MRWEADLQSPVASVSTSPAVLTSQSTAQFAFECNNVGCSYVYSVDGGGRQSLGNDSGNSSLASSTVPVVDALIVAAPSRVSRDGNNSFTLMWRNGSDGAVAMVSPCRVGGGCVLGNASSNVTVEVRRDGDTAWRDVVQLPSYNATSGQLALTSLSPGRHTLEARAVSGDGGVDDTPWTHVWHVDLTPPVVSFASTPSVWSDDPRGSVLFIMRSSEELTLFECRVWSGVSCVSTNGTVVSSTAASMANCGWQRLSAADIEVSGLVAATAYDIEVRGVDAAGKVGEAVSWRWSSGGCPSTVPVAVSSVESLPLQRGRRSIAWQSFVTGSVAWNGSFAFECRHSVDGAGVGVWSVCDSVASSGGGVWRIDARPGAWHTVDVRVAVPS
jgi:hypothetical protein